MKEHEGQTHKFYDFKSKINLCSTKIITEIKLCYTNKHIYDIYKEKFIDAND